MLFQRLHLVKSCRTQSEIEVEFSQTFSGNKIFRRLRQYIFQKGLCLFQLLAANIVEGELYLQRPAAWIERKTRLQGRKFFQRIINEGGSLFPSCDCRRQ